MSHANARLTPAGRLLLCQRIEAGTTQTEATPATIWRVLKRHGLNRLSWMDRPTG